MMAGPPALRKLEARMEASGSLLCIGLDPDLQRMPERRRSERFPLFAFCREIVDATARFACAFKPNTAFFEAHGAQGWEELTMLCQHIRIEHPASFLLCDAKRADIGNTNLGYVRAIFDGLGADAITLHPLLGREALQPFLDRTDKASVILCRTSNPGAGEFQDLLCEGQPLWEHIASAVSRQWNTHGNCMLVVGATWPEEMRRVRAVAPEMIFLVPGIGAQGGEIDTVVRAGLRADGLGLLLSSSRDILYAEDPGSAARRTHEAIQQAREQVYAGR